MEPSEEQIDAYLRTIQQTITEYGWAVQGVGEGADGEPSFSYTAGLTEFGHAEIVMVGLHPLTAQGILNGLGEAIRGGVQFAPGDVIHGALGGDLPLAVLEAANTDEITVPKALYGDVSVLQAVWCDTEGRFPWQEGYSMRPELQPALGPAPAEFRDVTIS